MPAVVRVKRRIDEEPLSAFVLNGKKRRLDENIEILSGADGVARTEVKDEISTVLKFAGTIKEQDNTATSQLARLDKEAAKQLVMEKSNLRNRKINVTERSRNEMRQSLHEQRFRVVNCMRTCIPGVSPLEQADSENLDAAKSAKEVTIVDIEKQSSTTTGTAATALDAQQNSMQRANIGAGDAQTQEVQLLNTASTNTDSDSGYVYDLYLPENEQQAEYVDMMDDNYLSIRAFDDLVYEDRFNNDLDEEYDSEDSNQENYFANDYPDEDEFDNGNDGFEEDDNNDDGESDGARHIRQAVEKFIFDESDDGDEEKHIEEELYADLSSDEDYNPYQDPYIQSIDTEDGQFVDDIDYCDVDRYGMAYARYKARIMKQQNRRADNGSDKDDDDDDDDIYNDAEKNDDSDDDSYQSASELELYD